jgi:hypothetical protein
MSRDLEISTNTKGDVSIINLKGDVTAQSGEAIESTYQKISSNPLLF